MNIPFRTRRTLKRLAIALLVIAMILAAVTLCWFLWLDRYVIYSRDGVRLDFGMELPEDQGQAAIQPTLNENINIYYNDDDVVIVPTGELTKLAGYYVDADMLANDMARVMEQVDLLPAGTPLMIDVKNGMGGFFYSTAVGLSQSSSVNQQMVDDLITQAQRKGLYLIARVPALQDRQFGLQNVNCGLFLPSGIGLWMDDDGAYWLNPAAQGTQAYLIQIAAELRTMGFDEVVFSQFDFPKSDKYQYDGDKEKAIANAAATLVASCATDSFCVSFVSEKGTFVLPEGRSRLYLENATGSEVSGLAQQTQLPDPSIRVVFLTTVNDTRFDAYGVLRPLTSAIHEEE